MRLGGSALFDNMAIASYVCVCMRVCVCVHAHTSRHASLSVRQREEETAKLPTLKKVTNQAQIWDHSVFEEPTVRNSCMWDNTCP